MEAGLCGPCARDRDKWERYLVQEGERIPTEDRADAASGWRWLGQSLLWAFLIVGACLLGAMVAHDYDKETALRDQWIGREQ